MLWLISSSILRRTRIARPRWKRTTDLAAIANSSPVFGLSPKRAAPADLEHGETVQLDAVARGQRIADATEEDAHHGVDFALVAV